MRIKITDLATIGFMLSLFLITPVWAGDLDSRIKDLEQELAQLKAEQEQMKGQQIELKNEATAAAAALPLFRYRPGGGLMIEDANRSWGIRFFTQFVYYSTFWLDDNRSKNSAVQGAIHPRRLRPRFNYYWDRGFHEFDFWVDINNSGSTTGGPWNAFKANYAAHFEQMSPFLPTVWVGANPSFRLNPVEFWSSVTGGRGEYGLLSQGNGIILATQTRGAVLDWNNIPLGMAEGELHLGYSIFGQDAFAQLSNAGITNDHKAFSWGVGLEPFKKTKNPWLRGLLLYFGGKVQSISENAESGYNIRTQQTRAQRVSLIRTASRDGGWEYYTPGLMWRYGPYTLRVSGQFDNSHRDTVGGEGSAIRGRARRITHELFLWSPKGPLTGSVRDGGLMISPIFDRVDVRAPNAMSGCSPAGGGCQGAYAINTGIALWYFIGRGRPLNFGIIWDHWRVNKANSDVATRIDKNKTGRDVDFNTLTLAIRSTW